MARRTQTYAVRLAVEGGGQVKAELVAVGQSGEQNLLRLAPSGHVVGIDMDASLRLAAARGHDLAVLSELLPAAEAGVVKALSTARARGNGR